MNRNTIIVNTCDAYEDVWALFFSAFKEHWPNCAYQILVNTESKPFQLDHPNVTAHASSIAGQADKWGLRLKETLASCNSSYVTMLYDDFVLEGKVDVNAIEQCMDWLDRNPDTTVFYFIHSSANSNIDDGRYPHFEAIPQTGDYKLNSAPAVWRRDKLLNYIEDDDTPWAWECFGSYRAYKNKETFYSIKKEFENIYPYNYSMGGAIYRGKWVKKIVAPLIKKYNLNIDLSHRGIADEAQQDNKRSLKWKIDFFLLGYKMISFNVFVYIYRIIKIKISKFMYA